MTQEPQEQDVPKTEQSASKPPIPTSIDAYLEAVKQALGKADKALIQDALYDAEDHLRSELAENPGLSEADLIAKIWNSYGAPEEVAAIYRDTEIRVARALKPPTAPKQESLLGKFFGIVFDWRAYTSLFYMLLSVASGIFYFTWVVSGLSLSLGLLILIIGIPFLILFLGSVRILSLVEGRIIEAMLGVRMPRRPIYADRSLPWTTRIKEMFIDPRTWATMLYMLAMMPLGILYFAVASSLLSVTLGLLSVPFATVLLPEASINFEFGPFGHWYSAPFFGTALAFLTGVVLLFATLHIAKGIGFVHGQIAKHLLVKEAQD